MKRIVRNILAAGTLLGSLGAVGVFGALASNANAAIPATVTEVVSSAAPAVPASCGTVPAAAKTYTTIQAAVTAAVAQAVIYVCPGTYTEQVIDNTVAITLMGAGAATTIIDAPATLATSDGAGDFPVLGIIAPGSATISGLTVNGAAQGATANSYFVGVEFYNAPGSLTNSTVEGVHEPYVSPSCGAGITPVPATLPAQQSGAQTGSGIFIDGTSTPNVVTLSSDTVTDFEKAGIIYTGPGATGTITSNQVTGSGFQECPAQNGIEVRYGAIATVSHNQIANLLYAGNVAGGSDASGILGYQSGTGTIFSDNTIVGAQNGINADGASGTAAITVSGNSIAGSAVGINLTDGTFTVSENSIDGTGAAEIPTGSSTAAPGLPEGIAVNQSAVDDSGPVIATLTSNQITDTNAAVYAADVANTTGVTATCNAFDLTNVTGVDNTTTTSINAEDNYWGSPSGAGPVGTGTGSKVTTNVDFSKPATSEAACANLPLPLEPATVTGVSPGTGTYLGGTTTTISGTNFDSLLGPTTVDFGGSPATSVTVVNDSEIQAVSPAGTGTVGITVTTPSGTSAAGSHDSFVYTPAVVTPPTTIGYDMVGSDGGVFVFPVGQTTGYYGSLPGLNKVVNNIVGMVASSDSKGYFLVGSDGGVFSFGDTTYEGSLPGLKKTVSNIVGIVPTSDDKGYYLVGSDGGVFTFGDAKYLGSLPGSSVLVNDIVGIAATPNDQGYWLVGSNGTVYPFGNAATFAPIVKGTSPISGITSSLDGAGYWVVAQNGAVYSVGDALAEGSLPTSNIVPTHPVISLVPNASGKGYYLVASDGGIFSFGTTTFEGSVPQLGLSVSNIVGAIIN